VAIAATAAAAIPPFIVKTRMEIQRLKTSWIVVGKGNECPLKE
jgi:hypothetical protein